MTRERRRERALRVRRARWRNRHLRDAYVVAAVLIATAAGWLTIKPLTRSWFDGTTTGALEVRASMAGFQPTVLTAKAGQPTTLRLRSMDTRFHLDGGGRHQFAIDELGIDLIAPPLGSAKVTFTVPEPGTYPFYCSICCGGKANPSMWGTLVVEA